MKIEAKLQHGLMHPTRVKEKYVRRKERFTSFSQGDKMAN